MYSPLQLEVDVISCLVPVPLAFSENLIGALKNYLSQWNAIGSTGKSGRKVCVLSWPQKEGREKITYEGDCGRACRSPTANITRSFVAGYHWHIYRIAAECDVARNKVLQLEPTGDAEAIRKREVG